MGRRATGGGGTTPQRLPPGAFETIYNSQGGDFSEEVAAAALLASGPIALTAATGKLFSVTLWLSVPEPTTGQAQLSLMSDNAGAPDAFPAQSSKINLALLNADPQPQTFYFNFSSPIPDPYHIALLLISPSGPVLVETSDENTSDLFTAESLAGPWTPLEDEHLLFGQAVAFVPA